MVMWDQLTHQTTCGLFPYNEMGLLPSLPTILQEAAFLADDLFPWHACMHTRW